MDEETELPEFNPRERIRQQISVPFLWELKPGTPKRDWISKPVSSMFSCPSPARLVVSVPFQWEEKPGKPLPDASPFHVPSDHTDFPPSSYSLNPFAAEGEDYSLGFDLEAFGFPVDNQASGNRHETWYSSETKDYSTQNGSIDASAQEFLFPLPPPEESAELVLDDDHLTNPWSLPRSTLTLGELMLLSRKLSCRRMPVDVKNKSPSSMKIQTDSRKLQKCSMGSASVELIKKILIACS